MGCMPSKNAHVKIATPNAKIAPHDHEDKLSSAKAHILDSIKRRDPILFEKTMHAHQVRPTEVLGQADQKRTILHFIAEANFSQGMTLALDYILHHQQNQVEQAVNIKDSDGNTPAIICCLQDAGNTLEVLLKSGHLNLNAKNNSGQTALTIAADRDGACQKILNSQPVTREATTRSVIPSSQISQSPETPKIPLSDEIAATQPGPRGSMKLRSVQSLKKESKISPDTRLYQMLNDLVASNKEFIDEEFPHDNESIVPEEMQSQYLKDYGTVKWLRPHEFLGCDVTAVSLFEGIDINHVNESPLAGCDLYSAFAAMLEFPQRLLKIFTTIESNKQGAYSVKFLVSGIPVEILLDDYFPCSMNSKPLFSRPANIELWFSLLEKAFAKLYGSFSELNSISISEAFQTMTGMPSSQHAIKEVTDDELWNQLLEYDKRNYIFCAGNNKTANDKKNRIFTVARLYEVDNYRILKLKNHFEDFVWKGDFSDGSELWTKELKAEVGHYAGEKNYFYMEIKEFMKQFEFVATCHYNESLIRNSQETACNHKKPVFFEIEVDREMEVFISVHQKLARFVDDEGYEVSPVEILVAEDLDDGILRKVSYGEKDAFIGKPTVFADDKIRTKLSEGRYVIRVKIRWVDEQKHDFTLNVFSPHPLSFKKVKSRHYPDFLERVYLDAGSRSSERYQLGNRCEFGSSWCGPHLWLFGMNKGTKTWNLEINFNKIENLRLCKKYRTEENILKLEIPPKGQAVAFAKRINSKTVELNWNFNQSWS